MRCNWKSRALFPFRAATALPRLLKLEEVSSCTGYSPGCCKHKLANREANWIDLCSVAFHPAKLNLLQLGGMLPGAPALRLFLDVFQLVFEVSSPSAHRLRPDLRSSLTLRGFRMHQSMSHCSVLLLGLKLGRSQELRA